MEFMYEITYLYYSTARFKLYMCMAARAHKATANNIHIVMLPSSSVMLSSFFQYTHYKWLQATCNEQLAHELHLLREKRL